MRDADMLGLLAGLGGVKGYQPPRERLEEMFTDGTDELITDPALRRLQVMRLTGGDGDISTAERA